MLLTLFACAGGDALDANLNAATWSDGWSTHLVWRAAAESTDTAAAADPTMDGALAAEAAATRTLTVRALDDAGPGATLRAFTFDTTDGLAVSAVDGAPLDPPVILLPTAWKEGDAVTSGAFTATAEPLADIVTWYGTFTDVATVQVSGPADSPVAGTLRFASGVGLVQFALPGLEGDLVWYDPAAAE